jgi:protein-disulfide isomerase
MASFKTKKIVVLIMLISVALVTTGIITYNTFEKDQAETEEVHLPTTPKETQVPSPSEPTQSPPTPKETKPSYERIEVSVDDDPVKGSENAPVTIIDFGNFQCDACAKFTLETLPLIEEEYIKTGKVKLVFRDVPVAHDEYAQKAAEAAECADDQGKFWEYHDILFEKQMEWSVEGVDKLKEYARTLGLDMRKFNDCLDSGKHADEVQKDLKDAISYGAKTTPTIFINGIKVEGAQPYSVYKELIEQELSLVHFENDNIDDNGVSRLAIVIPSIIPERQEVTLKIISVVDYKDRMELDFERSDNVNVSVLWSSASYLNGSEKSMLVQLEKGSAEVPLIGYMAEAIVLKAEWVSGESYMETWMTTAWVGIDPPK